MDKIIVLTGDPDRDDNLIKCLKMLFPECDIEIQKKQPEKKMDELSSIGQAETDTLDKFMSFL